jgi:hypothetical protein
MVIQILQCRHWASARRQATVSVPYPATLVSGRCSATMRSGALSAGSLDRSGYGSRSPGTPAARSPRHWEIAGDPDSREPTPRLREPRLAPALSSAGARPGAAVGAQREQNPGFLGCDSDSTDCLVLVRNPDNPDRITSELPATTASHATLTQAVTRSTPVLLGRFNSNTSSVNYSPILRADRGNGAMYLTAEYTGDRTGNSYSYLPCTEAITSRYMISTSNVLVHVTRFA